MNEEEEKRMFSVVQKHALLMCDIPLSEREERLQLIGAELKLHATTTGAPPEIADKWAAFWIAGIRDMTAAIERRGGGTTGIA